MTTPENINIQDLPSGRPEKRPFLFEGFNAPKKTIGPRLADGEDSQGLYSVDRWGRKWYHVDHIDGYSGRIIFYHNKGSDKEMSMDDLPQISSTINVQGRRTRGGGRRIRPKI